MPAGPQITPVATQFGERLSNPSPFYATFTVRGGSSPVQFHLLLECDGPEPEARCQAALTSLQRRLSAMGQASLTTTLHGAFQACHQALAASGGSGVGVTCVASRGEEVFLAAVANIDLFQLDRAGVRPVRLSVPGTMTSAMGEAAEVTAAMERLDLHPGESVLVASAALAQATNMEGLETIMSGSPATAADRIAMLMSNTPLFLALIITAAPE